MSKNRYDQKIDANQPEIVKRLREIPGMTVEVGYNDILIGYEGLTFWREIKDESKCLKDGSIPERIIKPDQKRIRDTFTGDYAIVCNFNQIIDGIAQKFSDIGFIRIANNLRRFKR